MTPNAERKIRITVAIPSYRRPDRLRLLLDALPARIAEVEDAEIDVLVIDNDPEGSAQAALHGLDVAPRYVAEPVAGIAAARNRALDECTASDLLAFIDDDEIPQPGWLFALLETWHRHRSSAVMGRVVSVFDENADPWALATNMFHRPSYLTGTPLTVAAAGNLLLDLHQIRGLGVRFDESLGLGGGEDTLFSMQLVALGGTIVWCEESATDDYVVASRVTREWVQQRAFSSANAWTRIQLMLARSTLRRTILRTRFVITGAARILIGYTRHVFGRVSRNLHHDADGIRLVYRGSGTISAAFGHQHREYMRATNP